MGSGDRRAESVSSDRSRASSVGELRDVVRNVLVVMSASEVQTRQHST